MEILGWIVVAWFVGMFAADSATPKFKERQSGDYIYAWTKENADAGQMESGVVKYKAYGYSTCRPQCYMSGSFKDGVLRPMVPFPFRRGKFFECPQEGELDSCTGEIYRQGKWIPLGLDPAAAYLGEWRLKP